MKTTTKSQRTRGPEHDPKAPVPAAQRRRPGRPTLYEERVTIVTACFLAKRGATDVEIAAELGISVATLYKWYGDHPEFSEAVKAAKNAQDDRVRNSLLRRATGYQQTVEKIVNGKRYTVVEEVAPDTTAQIFWLKNRRPQEFREQRDVAIVVPETPAEAEATDTRQLALAVLALLNEATDENAAPQTIDLTPNEETDDEAYDEDGGEDLDLDFA